MKEKLQIFSEEEIENISKLGDVLRKIHNYILLEKKIRVKNGRTIWLVEKPDRLK